jgi:UDP-4-amino-4,6-dideoxy-N-acetyl-beta-L-altrosamine transaminase
VIPYGRQTITDDDVAAVVEALRSSHLTQGPAIDRFERAVADYCGAEHAVAVANGTAALHLACLAMDLGPGDRLWTVPNTFVASANCALYCGADVGFVDIDPHTYDLSIGALETKLALAAERGLLPQIVVPVHFAGRPCEMATIGRLADAYGFRVLEDASHALGGRDGGHPIGSCEHSAAAVFSFHPVKIVTSGEGGMVVTNDAGLARRLRRLREHGITREPAEMSREPDGPWYYELATLGYNYRITDLQAALGTSQMKRLDEFVTRRRALAARYRERLAGLPLRLPDDAGNGRSAWHLYVVRIDRSRVSRTRREIFERLRADGIGVQVHYIPVHLQPLYRRLGFEPGDCPQAEAYYEEAITLPLFPAMSEGEQDLVVAALERALR